MRNRKPYRREFSDWEMYRMERELGATLHGVAPRPDFVSQLRTRLASEPVQARNNRRVFQYVLLSLAGVISGVLLVIATARGLTALRGYRGVLNEGDRRPALTAIEA